MHLVTLGSPLSEMSSRGITAFVRDGEIVRPAGSSGMKYLFGERSSVPARRYIGTEKVERRLGTLYVQTAEGYQRIVDPAQLVDADCWLSSDWLLVTSLPNASDGDLRYVNIGGVTGVGTKAISTALTDPETLAELDKQVETPFYQALFRVQEVNHQTEERNSTPGSVELVDVEAYAPEAL